MNVVSLFSHYSLSVIVPLSLIRQMVSWAVVVVVVDDGIRGHSVCVCVYAAFEALVLNALCTQLMRKF